ncbi:hypothetical protein FJY93_00515 [Candidatus Kaiserbacteria bacterium]|nr:hypothetical protein [Candidatus Kaiserbacteria bacterium]
MGFMIFVIASLITGFTTLIGIILIVDSLFADAYLGYLGRTYPEIRSWGYTEYRRIKERSLAGMYVFIGGVALLGLTLLIGEMNHFPLFAG